MMILSEMGKFGEFGKDKYIFYLEVSIAIFRHTIIFALFD